MINNLKLNVCHVIAYKFKDKPNKRAGAIKLGGLVLSIANYLGFDINNIPFDKLLGPSLIDLYMMEAMGIIEMGRNRVPILIGDQPQQQAMQDEEEEEGDMNQVMQCLDNLELQVGVIDSNVGELTSMGQNMNTNINMINHNLIAYFQA